MLTYDHKATNPAPSFAKSRVGGALIVVVGLVIGYFAVWQPLQQARTGVEFSYSLKSVMLAPAFVYAGIAVMITDLRDGQAFQPGADGRKHLTRKGYFFFGGLIIVEGIVLLMWNLYLKSLGYSAF